MKKAIYEDYGGSKHLIGFCPEYMWKSVGYFGAPRESGRYLVITKSGRICEMMCTGTHTPDDEARRLFEMAADGAYNSFSDAYIDERAMTDSDLMDLYRSPWGRWYSLEEWYEYENCHNDIHIYTKDSDKCPLYFMDINLDNQIELNEQNEIAGSNGIRYYSYDYEGNVIEKEENV